MTAHYIPLWGGPIGFPVFPLGVLGYSLPQTTKVEIAVWVFGTERKRPSAPRALELEFADGSVRPAEVVQLSQFNFQREAGFWDFPPFYRSWRDGLSSSYHFLPSRVADLHEPLAPAHAHRYIFGFRTPTPDAKPVRLHLAGQPPVDLANIDSVRYVVTGQTAEGRWIASAFPTEACREAGAPPQRFD